MTLQPKKIRVRRDGSALELGGIPTRVTPFEQAWSKLAHLSGAAARVSWQGGRESGSSELTVFHWPELGLKERELFAMSHLGTLAAKKMGLEQRFVPFALLARVQNPALPLGQADDGVLLFDLWDGDGDDCAVVLVEGSASERGKRIADRIADLQLTAEAEPPMEAPGPEDGDAKSRALLDEAAGECRKDVIAALLDDGADVNYANADGVTALHLASEIDAHNAIRLLVERGADLEAKDKAGWLPDRYTESDATAKLLGRLRRA